MSAALPQVAPPARPVGKTVPAPTPAFKATWTAVSESVVRVPFAAGATNFFLPLDSGHVVARALEDGAEVWRISLAADVGLTAGDDLVFVAKGDVLHALEQSTGRERWTAMTGPLAVQPTWRAGWIFAAATNGSIAALRATDGSPVWQQSLGAAVAAPIAIDGDRLFASLADRQLVSLDIAANGNVVWKTSLDAVGGQPLAAGERLFLSTVNGGFFSYKQESGRLDWPHTLIRPKVVGCPVADGARVFIATSDNRVVALDRRSGTIQWFVPLAGRPAEQLIVDRQQVILPLASGDIVILAEKDGKPLAPLGAQKPGQGIRLSTPLVVGGPPGAPQLLRLTMGTDQVETLTSYRRDVK
jgi:outer membrane protein assembly factor BamB